MSEENQNLETTVKSEPPSVTKEEEENKSGIDTVVQSGDTTLHEQPAGDGEKELTPENVEKSWNKKNDAVHLETDSVENAESADEEMSKYDTEIQENEGFNAGTELTVDPAMVDSISKGFLQKFLPSLEKAKFSLDEVLSNQQVLIETLEQENAKFTECQAMKDLTETMVHAKRYYNKLINIKKEMSHLHEKSAKLKKRAVKLQQHKQKDELQKAQKREREQERERLLAARVAKHSDS